MILWDRVKKSFDGGIEIVRRVAVTLSERARLESAVARLMIDKGTIETRLDKSCRELGERVHYLWAQGGEDVMKDAEVMESLKDISDLTDRVAELNLMIHKVSLGEEAE